MKYFEFNEPYYALIMAENQTSAVVTYSNEVCILDDYDYKDTANSLVEVDKELAWEKYKKAQTEDGESILETELQKEFRSNRAQALLVARNSL